MFLRFLQFVLAFLGFLSPGNPLWPSRMYSRKFGPKLRGKLASPPQVVEALKREVRGCQESEAEPLRHVLRVRRYALPHSGLDLRRHTCSAAAYFSRPIFLSNAMKRGCERIGSQVGSIFNSSNQGVRSSAAFSSQSSVSE